MNLNHHDAISSPLLLSIYGVFRELWFILHTETRIKNEFCKIRLPWQRWQSLTHTVHADLFLLKRCKYAAFFMRFLREDLSWNCLHSFQGSNKVWNFDIIQLSSTLSRNLKWRWVMIPKIEILDNLSECGPCCNDVIQVDEKGRMLLWQLDKV